MLNLCLTALCLSVSAQSAMDVANKCSKTIGRLQSQAPFTKNTRMGSQTLNKQLHMSCLNAQSKLFWSHVEAHVRINQAAQLRNWI